MSATAKIAGLLLSAAIIVIGGATAASAESCTPRKTCGKISSCEEAHWYLDNCPWGGKLDRDSDGIPCESLCGG